METNAERDYTQPMNKTKTDYKFREENNCGIVGCADLVIVPRCSVSPVLITPPEPCQNMLM